MSIAQSALQSTLECFYNETCLSEFRHFMGIDSSTDMVPPDRSLLFRFSIESTVQELVNQLMVETRNFSSSFEDYYDACHPKQCSYTRVAKNDASDVITTLFGLVGGLEQHTRSSGSVGCQAHSIAFSATSRRSHTVPTFGSTVDYTRLVPLLLIFRSSDTDRCCNAYFCCLVLLAFLVLETVKSYQIHESERT